MYTSIKCKKCRQLLFDEAEVAKFKDAHSEHPINFCEKENCPSLEELICISEENLPDWIKRSVEEKQWSKGKINCKHCGARIGAFDFISGAKCACKNHVLPSMRIIKSKVDLGKARFMIIDGAVGKRQIVYCQSKDGEFIIIKKMKFRFCGDADCPDWILAEINNLSRLSSVKVKMLLQVVVQGIINPPIDMEKAEKLFADSKLDTNIDLKACMACLNYILTSTVRYNCDHNALHSELQQLGLPREHSTSIKRVADDQSIEIAAKLRASTLRVNPLEKVAVEADKEINCAKLNLQINDEKTVVTMSPFTLNVLLENLKSVRNTMKELNDNPYVT